MGVRSARGIAYLAVLWVLFVLGALAASFAFSMRTEALAARNGADAARAYYQARAGIARALVVLPSLAPDNAVRETLSGSGESATYEVRVEAEAGKVDVNFASESLIKSVLRAAGLSEEDAESLGDAILDWRDPDGQPRARGAEEGDYLALAEPLVPRNGRLASIEELRYVRGVTAAIYDRLMVPIFTVHGLSPQVDVNVAPPRVLLLLPSLTPEAVTEIVSHRERESFRAPVGILPFFGPGGIPAETLAALATGSSSRVYTVTAVGRAGESVRVVRCLVDASRAGLDGARVLRWEDNAPLEEAAE